MTDSRIIPLSVSVTFPGQPLAGRPYRTLICDPNGAAWSSLADPITGDAIATIQVPQNISHDSTALVTAAAVYGRALQPGFNDLAAADVIVVNGDGSITPVDEFIGLAGTSALMLADPRSGNFSTPRAFPCSGQTIPTEIPNDAPMFLATLGLDYGFDQSAGWIPKAAASAPQLATLDGLGAQLATRPGEWTLTSAPAAATVATATRAAGAAGVRHVLTSFVGDLNAVVAQVVPVEFVVRDGAAGAGTILYRRRLIAAAGTSAGFDVSDLNIVGSAATAMTVEVTAAPAATNFATVSASGYSVSEAPDPPAPPVDGLNFTIGEHPTSPGAYGYGNGSNGDFGVLNSGSQPPNNTFIVQYVESVGGNVSIRAQGVFGTPAANAFTSFSVYSVASVLLLGPVLFSTAGFTGVSGANTREWSWDTLSTALHTLGLGGTFILVVTV